MLTTPLTDTLRWQFDLTWRLAEVHLPNLTDESCLWQPAPVCWTVHRNAEGRWRPDFSEKEPDFIPAVSIAWITWHVIFWWSGLLSAAQYEKPLPPDAVDWPGSAEATKARLNALASDWSIFIAQLTNTDLERPFAYPWAEPRPLRLAAAWCNAEMMKNVAEIGTVRHLYEIAKR